MIKTIIFDFGDVFINLNKEATIKTIAQRFGAFKQSSEIEAFNNQYETGTTSTKEFVQYYAAFFKTNDTKFLINAWNAIILDFPNYRLDFLEALKKENKFKLILLSNTNELHIERVKESMTISRYQKFKNCFDAFYLSHEIGLRKPNADIFNFVLEQNSLQAEECLFIDDTKEHIESANLLGINTWHLIPGKYDIVNVFSKNQHLF